MFSGSYMRNPLVASRPDSDTKFMLLPIALIEVVPLVFLRGDEAEEGAPCVLVGHTGPAVRADVGTVERARVGCEGEE